jgi:hypothetical protein
MSLKTPGLGLIVLGTLLLGAQLVLYLGYGSVSQPNNAETHIEPVRRTTSLPGIFGATSLVAGLALSARDRREADAPPRRPLRFLAERVGPGFQYRMPTVMGTILVGIPPLPA